MGLMGSYLSKPVTEKESADETNDKLNTGTSSMQGWRVTQEDAHNCLLDFDVNTSLFAVYDGHGGHEVAVYCSQNLPDYIKNTEAYKSQNFEKALIDAFLGFDATIASDEVIAKLQKIALDKEENESSCSSDLEENVKNLYEEATMPLERVIEKYTSNLKNAILNNLQKESEKHPASPYLRAPKDAPSNEACSSSGESSNSKSLCVDATEGTVSSSSNTENSTKDIENGTIENSEIQKELVESSGSNTKDNKTVTDADPESNKVDVKTNQSNQNGEIETPPKEEIQDITGTPQENGEISKKGKGKATAKTKGIPKSPPRKTRPTRNAQQLYNKLLEFESESESEDEEDKTFQEPTENSSSDEENPNAARDSDNSEASSEEEDGEEEEEEDDLEKDLDEIELKAARHLRENPGANSGCTAVVALLHENQLFVANAGDSRCIVSRNGKAVEMSFDHKPFDEPEYDRIKKAGGWVSSDGRVDGGLNLSRAIGDHAYKQKKELSDREQMITALPDVHTLTINPTEDEFMVLACDGIWNSMSSQEVVDFVRPKIQETPEKLSRICEEMFENCLASGTLGDGTGCDNMTAIIIQFKKNLCKRASDDEVESGSLKRSKIEEAPLESPA